MEGGGGVANRTRVLETMGLMAKEPTVDSSTHLDESASQGNPASHCTGYGGGPRSGSINCRVRSKMVQQTRVQRLPLVEAGADQVGRIEASKMYEETVTPVASKVLFVGAGEMEGTGHNSQPSGRTLRSTDFVSFAQRVDEEENSIGHPRKPAELSWAITHTH